MNEKSAWDNFTVSGSVADYLTYSMLKNGGEFTSENFDGRDRDQGASDQGIGQSNNDTDEA